MDAVLGFLGALVGAAIGAYAGVVYERRQAQNELEGRRRDQIREDMLVMRSEASEALAAFWALGLEMESHGPSTRRGKQLLIRLGSHMGGLREACNRVDTVLPESSPVPTRVSELYEFLDRGPHAPADDPADERGFERAAALHDALKLAIQAELNGAARVNGSVRPEPVLD